MSLEKDLDQGAKAEKLLNDETLTQAFENVRKAIFEKIEQTPLRDDEGLRQLRIMLKLLRDVRANLERALRDGKLAAKELEIQKDRKVRLFR